MADITVIGNVNNPEVKTTQNGKVVLNFSLAENHFRNVNGEWQEDGTTWRQVTVWERTAEALADVLEKGMRVIVVGPERLREFEARDGSKGKSLEMTAKHVGIIPKSPQQGQLSDRYAGDPGYAQQSPYSQGQQAQGWGQPTGGDLWGGAPAQSSDAPF